MKRIFTFLFVILLTICLLPLKAQTVEQDKALNVARNFYVERLTALNDNTKAIPVLSDFELLNISRHATGKPLYYVFDVKNGGFVIASAQAGAYPIIGYSFDNKFAEPINCPAFNEWMKNYSNQITSAVNNNLSPTQEIEQAWIRYNGSSVTTKDVKAVNPLLLTNWDQSQFYNAMCPVDANGSGGHVYAGCVATSMAQVMKYYNFPVQGTGSNSYNSSPYGTQSANFGTAVYRWNEMPLSLTTFNTAVAELLYHCGVSVNMNYGADGSSASTTTAATALKNRFKYASSASYKSKYTYTTTNWNNLLKGNLDAGKPMIYSGSPQSGAGHAWNCDGYQGTDHFHMNWGWSGYYNGYFYLNALTAGGDDFSYFQGAVVDIYPGSNYPYFCSGSKTLTGTIGTFDDGSGPSNYQNNSDCYWLIDPTINVARIKLSFDALNIESSHDVITVYDGDNTSAPVLGTFSGSTIPSLITSNTNKVLVRFQTNATANLSGWHASYTTTFPNYCTNLQTLTAITDTFSDGSGSSPYNPVTSCRWRIAPPGASSITLNFQEFNIPNVTDVLEIYDQSTGNVLLDTYNGTTPPASYTYNASKILVWLKTNTQTPGQGFRASYSAVVSGIDQEADLTQFDVYPNPAQDMLHVALTGKTEGQARVSLMNISGQTVYSADKVYPQGNTSFSIPVSNLAQGIYILQVLTNKSIINQRIIIER